MSKFGLVGVGCVCLVAACGSDDERQIAGLTEQCQASSADEVCEVFRLVNLERSERGLDLYDYDVHLAEAAQAHANDQVARGYFGHDSLDGRGFADRVEQTDYEGSPGGENIAQGQRSAEQVMQSWMSSSGHRGNILSQRFTDIGIGMRERIWVQVFGRGR